MTTSTKADSFLKEYVSGRELKKSQNTAQPKVSDDANTFLTDVTMDQPDTTDTKSAKRLHRRAQKLGAADDTKDKHLEEQAEQEAQEQKARDSRASSQNIIDKVRVVGDNAANNIAPMVDKVGALQTVGGIGLLLVILAIMLMLVIPVNSNGDTRGKQFWYMLSGRTTLQGRQVISRGSSADFGSTNTTTGVQTPIVPSTSTIVNMGGPPSYHSGGVAF